jgi:4a-hydroxytetrahydrobiopterin dehydratase
MPALSDDEIERELASLPGWERSGVSIRKEFRFDAYLDGIEFVRRVGEAAEAANHHPDMAVGYRLVTVELTSHDSGGVTSRDIRLARTVEGIQQG